MPLVIGIEVALIVADHDADGLEDFDGFLIVLRSHVRVARAGAHDHQAQDHDGSESQAESPLQVSHWGFLLLKIWFPQDGGNLWIWPARSPLSRSGPLNPGATKCQQFGPKSGRKGPKMG